MSLSKLVLCLGILASHCLVAHVYGLSYNYFDEMAQTYCASKISTPSFVFAIRRDCHGIGPKCEDICATASFQILAKINFIRSRVACFDAIHVGKSHARLADNPSASQPDAGKVNMFTYGYGEEGCTWKENHCGPNYCCCKAY